MRGGSTDLGSARARLGRRSGTESSGDASSTDGLPNLAALFSRAPSSCSAADLLGGDFGSPMSSASADFGMPDGVCLLAKAAGWSRLPPATRRGRPRRKEGPPPRLPVRLKQHPLSARAGTKGRNTLSKYPWTILTVGYTPRAG